MIIEPAESLARWCGSALDREAAFASMKTSRAIVLASVACIAGGVGGFLLERLHSPKAARTVEGSCLSEQLRTLGGIP